MVKCLRPDAILEGNNQGHVGAPEKDSDNGQDNEANHHKGKEPDQALTVVGLSS